jgi:Ca2+-binding RTX toxin-like protein
MAIVTIAPGFYLPMDGSDPRYVFSSVTNSDASNYELTSNISGNMLDLYGHFTYDGDGTLTGGTVTSALETYFGTIGMTITGAGAGGGGIDASSLVSLLTSDPNFYDIWALVLSSGDNIIRGGNGGSNRLYAFGGNDTLFGSVHNDFLVANTGGNVLIGGAGADQFVFRAPLGGAADVIRDFTPTQHDRIGLSETYFHALGPHGILQASHFHVANSVNASATIIYTTSNGYLYYDANGDHAGGRTHFATVSPHLVLNNTDFIVVG